MVFICSGHFNLLKDQFLGLWYCWNWTICLSWEWSAIFRIYLILVGRLMRKIIKERKAVTLIFPPKPICLSNFSCLPFIFTYCRWSIGVPTHYFIGICIFIWNCMCSSYIYEYYVFACQIGCKYLFLGWCVPFILFMGSWIYRKYCCIF